MFATYFHLRAKNSSGVVQKTFSPDPSSVGKNIEVSNGDAVTIDFEKIDFTTQNYFVGWKQKVSANFLSADNKYVAGVSGSGMGSLEEVLNALPAGGWLEYNIIDTSAGGSNWVACELKSISRKKIGKKNIGVEVTIELISRGLVTSPFAVS